MHDGGWWSFIRYDEKQDRPEVSWALIKRVATYGRPYAAGILVMLGAILVISFLNLIPPLLIRSLIDTAIPQSNVPLLVALSLAMIAIPLITGPARRSAALLQRLYRRGGDLRPACVALQPPPANVAALLHQHQDRRADVAPNNDVGGAQRAVTGTIVDLVTNVVTLTMTLAIMIRLEWRLTLLAIVVLPLFLIPARLLGRRVRAVVASR